MANELGDMAAEVVAASPKLQQRVSDFVETVLDEAFYALENGTPKMKADLINKMLPHLVRQLNDKAEDEEIKAMREAFEEFRKEQREGVGSRARTPDPETSDEEQARLDRVRDAIPTDGPLADVLQLPDPDSGRVRVRGGGK